jgi:hypothetical protein
LLRELQEFEELSERNFTGPNSNIVRLEWTIPHARREWFALAAPLN